MSKFTKAVCFIRKVHMPEKHILYSYAHDSLIMQYYNCVPLKGYKSMYKSMHTYSNWKPGNPEGRTASLQDCWWQETNNLSLTACLWQQMMIKNLLSSTTIPLPGFQCQMPNAYAVSVGTADVLYLFSHIYSQQQNTQHPVIL